MTKLRKTKELLGTVIWVCLLMFINFSVSAVDSDFGDGITVDSTIDAADANATMDDGACDDGEGNCTLRAAIMSANLHPGTDTIYVPAGTFILSIDGVDERCENPLYYVNGAKPCTGSGTEADPYLPVVTADASVGDLDITEDVIIIGAGSLQTIIGWGTAGVTAPAGDADPLTGDRIFHVQTTTTAINAVSLSGMTLSKGQVGLIPTGAAGVATPNAYDIEVVDDTEGNVTIWQFRRMGGAISIGAGYAVVKYEEKVHGPGTGGGSGIGGGGGGGSDHGGPFPGGKPGEEDTLGIGAVSLSDIVVVDNWSGADGGGLYTAAPATITEALLANNVAGGNGGGLYNDAAATLSYVTIGRLTDDEILALTPVNGVDLPNHAENGGGLFDTGSHTTTIANSAVNGNTAIGGAGIAGRAGVTIDLLNTTVSGNQAQDVGGGITTNGTVLLTNVSVVNNSATTDAPGGGGGLNAFGSGSYIMTNTLLAQNTIEGMDGSRDANCGCSGGSATCKKGRMNSLGWNLEDANSCGFILPTDLWNTDPMIDVLAYNGGLSETHALATNSPAVDAGSDAVCKVLIASYGDIDQRGSGFNRSNDGNMDDIKVCDIGAFELATQKKAEPPVTPPPAADNVPAEAAGGGNGGCSLNRNGKFDPLFPVLLIMAMGYYMRRMTSLQMIRKNK